MVASTTGRSARRSGRFDLTVGRGGAGLLGLELKAGTLAARDRPLAPGGEPTGCGCLVAVAGLVDRKMKGLILLEVGGCSRGEIVVANAPSLAEVGS